MNIPWIKSVTQTSNIVSNIYALGKKFEGTYLVFLVLFGVCNTKY